MVYSNSIRNSFLFLLIAAWSPDLQAGTPVYVANLLANTVTVIDSATNAITHTIPVCSRPGEIEVNALGTRVYVACGTFGQAGALAVIDPSTNSVIATVTGLGQFARGLAISPDSSRIYVTALESGIVYVIDAQTLTVTSQITGFSCGPLTVAVKPDGTRFYVNDSCGGPTPGTLRVYNSSTNALLASVTVGENPHNMAFSPDGGRLYVTNSRDHLPQGSVSVVDTLTNSVTATLIAAQAASNWAAISSDGTRLYIANGQGSVDVFNTTSNNLVASIPLAPELNGIALLRNTAFGFVASNNTSSVYVFNVDTNTLSATIPMAPGSGGFGVAIGSSPSPALYQFLGFQPPVNGTATNIVNAGRTIPIKFQVRSADGAIVSNVGVILSILSMPFPCDTTPGVIIDGATEGSGSTELRFEGGSFIFNWKTERAWSGCRQLQVTLADGQSYRAKFLFR